MNWEEILRRAMAGGFGGMNPNGEGTMSTWADPVTGMVLQQENGRTLASTNDVADKAQGDVQTWDITDPANVGQDWYSTPQGLGLGSMLGEFGKIAAPFALMALGGNYLNGLGGAGGEALGGASLEGMGAGGGALDAGAGLGAAEGAGYTGTSLAGATGGLTPAALEASLGTAGYGAAGAAGGASLGLSGALNGAGAGLGFAGASGGGLLSGLGSLGSSLGSLASVAGPLLGAAAGAQGNPGASQSNQRSLDPRIDAMVFGSGGNGGLLGDVSSWYQANKSGQNDQMKQASSMLSGLLTDPRVMQGLYTQGGAGLGMMQGGVAGNPFTRPGFNGQNWWG